MRKLWLGIVGLAAASTANAAIVTFHMVYNDDGTGTPTPGAFAIYATTSTGDNGGLFAYGVDLSGPALDFIGNSGQGVNFRKTTFPPNTKFAGFTTGYTTDAAKGSVTGVQDLGKTSTTVPSTWFDMIPVFGLGQEQGDLMSLRPPTHTGGFTDLNGNGTAYGSRSGNATSGDAGATGAWSHGYLMGIGFTSGNVTQVTFDKVSVDHKAAVWSGRNNGAPGDPVIPALAVVPIVSYENLLVVATPDYVALNGPTKGQNQAVGQAILVTGANGKYISEVDQLLTPSQNTGNAPINAIGDEAGNVYVMAKLVGTPGDIATLLGSLTSDVDATDSQFAPLHANYDAAFGAGGFNALFKFANVAGPKTFNWEFGTTTGVTVDQLAAVPEPGMISLLGLGAVGLVARRRRQA